MNILNATEARANLYALIEETTATGEPVQIRGERGDAVLIPIDRWLGIEETLYLLSIPGMRASIRKGLSTPVKDCEESLAS